MRSDGGVSMHPADIEHRSGTDALLAGQAEALQLALSGAPLEKSLGALVRVAIEDLGEGTRGAFYLADAERKGLHHIVGMPDSYAQCVDGFKIGPDSIACGLATFSGRPVLTGDVELAPEWRPWLWLAREHEFRGIWSFPVQTAEGAILGTFATYLREPRDPTPRDHELARILTRAAAIIVVRHFDRIERERAEEALRDADRRKDEFLAMLAHELRNPLAPLRNGLEMLRQADGDRELFDAARKVMERQVVQLVRLVDDMLDLARITQGRLRVRKEPVELADVLRTAVETVRPLVDASGHELVVTQPQRPILLDADPSRLAQVFTNLLSNAVKYTPAGGRIGLTVEENGEHCRNGGTAEKCENGLHGESGPNGRPEVAITIQDSGIGIAADDLPGLFRMFSQVAPTLERSREGLGIGLALSKGLLDLHGGAIAAESEGAGKGSRFVVRLPLSSRRDASDPDAPDANHERARATKRRVLVADDLKDAADSLALLLKKSGHEVRAVYSGEAAIAAAEEFGPDAVLLDIGMPRLSGYEVCRMLRERPWGKEILVVAVTGWRQEEDRLRSAEAGFDLHLVKPVPFNVIAKVLEDSFSGRRARRRRIAQGDAATGAA